MFQRAAQEWNQEELREKCSVNYVMVILRGVARGEFLGVPHRPLYEIIVLCVHNSGVENALNRKNQYVINLVNELVPSHAHCSFKKGQF